MYKIKKGSSPWIAARKTVVKVYIMITEKKRNHVNRDRSKNLPTKNKRNDL